MERTIGIIGMCMKDCTRVEGINLSSGEKLTINSCPSGDVCIQVGARAARYSSVELANMGNGNPNSGILAVAKEVRNAPEQFDHGQLRPLDDIAISPTSE